MAKILVVDDIIAHADITQKILTDKGHIAYWTDASNVAFDYLKNGYPDEKPYNLLCLDLTEIRREPDGPLFVPEGMAFLRHIRRDHSLRNLPVIGVAPFLPIDSRETWKDLFFLAGGDRFFEWPPDPNNLIEAVNELLKCGRTQIEHRRE